MKIALPRPLETGRLLVRRVEPGDLPGLLEVNSSDEVTRYLPYATWRTMEDAEAWLARVESRHAEGSALQLVVVEKAAGAVVGSCLLFKFDEGSARAELGYVLGKAHWGRGLMYEALVPLVERAFGEMALQRLEAEVDPRNAASDRLLRRLGFRLEGCLRQRHAAKGEITDSNIYGLLRHEWPGMP